LLPICKLGYNTILVAFFRFAKTPNTQKRILLKIEYLQNTLPQTFKRS